MVVLVLRELGEEVEVYCCYYFYSFEFLLLQVSMVSIVVVG